MMMVPYMFNEALMDDLFSNDWEHDFDRAMKAAAPRGMFGKRAANVMKTDVRENKDSYDVLICPASRKRMSSWIWTTAI